MKNSKNYLIPNFYKLIGFVISNNRNKIIVNIETCKLIFFRVYNKA